MRTSFLLAFFFIFYSCKEIPKPIAEVNETTTVSKTGISLIVLGTVQDAGSPHIACKKECCERLFENPDATRKIVSLGLIDHENQKTFLFEATPDITTQLKALKNAASWKSKEIPNGIFLTHAHIGHYTGLMYLGKEATNAANIPVFTMPKMKGFLEENGPWSQLVKNHNIKLTRLTDQVEIQITPQLKVIPFTVPHRDEYSETVGYKIIGPNKSVLFIPDINKWSIWETSIEAAIKEVNYAFLDATFFDGEELNTRAISEIPHPFVIESMALFEDLSTSEKQKINFIHFNHTNPLLNSSSLQSKKVLKNGFTIAQILDEISL